MTDIPVLKVVRMWAAAVQTHPGTKKPSESMDCTNMVVVGFLPGKPLARLIHQAVVILDGSASVCLLIIFMVGGTT